MTPGAEAVGERTRSAGTGVRVLRVVLLSGGVALLVLSLAWLDYLAESRRQREAVDRELGAVLEGKLRAVEWWHWERVSDGHYFASSMPRAMPGGSDSEDMRKQEVALSQRWIRSMCGKEHYQAVFRFDREARLVQSSSEGVEAPGAAELELVREVLTGESVLLKAVPGWAGEVGPGVDLAVRLEAEGGGVVGVLLLRCDSAKFFSTMLSVWPRPELLGQTVLACRQGAGLAILAAGGAERPLVVEPGLAGDQATKLTALMGEPWPPLSQVWDPGRGAELLLVRSLGVLPWSLIGRVGLEAVDGPARHHALGTGAVGGVISVIGISSWALGRRRRQIELMSRELGLRREMQRLAEHRELLNRSLVEHLPLRIYIKNRQSVYTSCNAVYARVLRSTPEEVIGKKDDAFWPPAVAQREREEDQRVFATGTVLEVDDCFETGSGALWTHMIKVPYHGPSGEVIGVLGIGEDVTRRMEIEQALRASEERHRLLFQQMRDGFAVLEPVPAADGRAEDFRFLDVNPAFGVMLGKEASGVVGRLLSEAMSGLELAWTGQFLRVAATGEPARFEEHAVPLGRHFEVMAFRPREGQVACTLIDITARTKAESALRGSLEEKNALLKEVHHRVKNNLQIVNSLLHLQSARLSDSGVSEAFHSTEDRVRSMALLHETLYRSGNVARADVPSYVESLCSHLQRSCGADAQRVRVSRLVDPLHLDLDVALPCGLIVTELVSNALRHGFPQGRSGDIVVSLVREEPDRIVLSIEDNGVGLPAGFDPTQSETLGLQLVYGLVSQLAGQVRILSEGGVKCRVNFASGHGPVHAREGGSNSASGQKS